MNQNDMSNRALLGRIIELEDKFVKLKRMYEDAINNIDVNNFATSLVKKIGDMETKINISAEGVTSQVSNELVESMISQKAGEITAIVTEAKGEMQSQIKLAADAITSEVSGQIKDAVTEEVNAKTASITLDMGRIESSVEDVTKKQNTANGEIEKIKTNYSTIQQTADEISSKVGMCFGNVVDCYSVDTVEEKYYTSDEDESGQTMETSKTYHYTNNNGEKYVYYDGSEWKSVDGPSIFSCFTQTRDGFKLKGDFTSTTNEGTTVDISGTRIDVYNGQPGEMPKLSMGFEDDTTAETPFVRLGQGDGGDGIEIGDFILRQGQGVIYKSADQLAMVYLTNITEGKGKYAGIYVTRNDDGTTNVRILGDSLTIDGISNISATAVFG